MSMGITARSIGKYKRLLRIFPTGRSVVVPLDDSLISGAVGGLADLKSKIENISSAKPNAILGYIGTLSLLSNIDSTIPTILNLSASTERFSHTNKVLLSSVERAISIGVDAVAVHINISSKYESDMLKNIGYISEKCDSFGIPLMILAYPRKEEWSGDRWIDENYYQWRLSEPDKYTDLISHCVRIAFELGADIIKTQFTGSEKSFRQVVQAAQGVPLLIAGGSVMNEEMLLSMCNDSIKAGGSGVCIGRNVFNRNNSSQIISAIKGIVIEGKSSEEVYKKINKKKEVV